MRGKRVLIGITGGIAAYKIAYLVRSLKKLEAEVKCIMTPASSDFISPLTLSTLSENPVAVEFWDRSNGTWNNHVELGMWADVFVIAPLTANSMAKMTSGAGDNLLLATYLSMKGKTLVAPAMDLDMYAHATTVRNLKQLEKDGVGIIPAEDGELASGLEGQGRMAEPETIVEHIAAFFESQKNPFFAGKKFLITAGPTHEAIDPVRFIGNHSSGKTGFALADEIANRGGEVMLITGPTNQKVQFDSVRCLNVVSAEEMFNAVKEHWQKTDVGIFTAAVADYRPVNPANQKIKKSQENLSVELMRNPDILAWCGANRSDHQRIVGFALETENLKENGAKKLEKKKANMIVLNTTADQGAAFGHDTNKISILDDHNNFKTFELKSKKEVASDILDYLKTYES